MSENREWAKAHHWYWGVIMLFIGFIGIWETSGWWFLIPTVIGFDWIGDDIYQHVRHTRDGWWGKADPTYESWVHRAYWNVMVWLRDHTSGRLNEVIRWLMSV
jgi:hypothetical protein